VDLRLIWLLNDFDLLSMLLHAATLSLEALLVGGVLFLVTVGVPAGMEERALRACGRGLAWVALGMVLAQCGSVVVATAMMVGNANVPVWAALTAGSLLAEACAALCALAVLLVWALGGRRLAERPMQVVLLTCAMGLMISLVGLSHAASQLEHRALLAGMTALHHLGAAAWIGAMPFLLATLKRTETITVAQQVVRRFSAMALVGAALLTGAGVGLALLYIRSASGLYGTSYGVMVMVKTCLLLLILALGAGNWYVAREVERAPAPLLLRLRRFAEVEVGLGLTAILAAASLTSQPPAIDLVKERLTLPEITARLRWETPRLTSPPVAALVPPTTLQQAVQDARFGKPAQSDINDRAWSEYNHHWAGLVVLLAGALALASGSRRVRWARFWPLSFAGLAVFILLRADPENWPLGPRPFWGSFFAPDVLQHRAAALLILMFAAFQCAVEAGRLRATWTRYAFPLMCAVGAALLLTHSHAAPDGKQELLAEMSHSALALFGAVAGWARWLELRLPERTSADGAQTSDMAVRLASYVWPVALMLVGLVLLHYREI
jgi:copper resistance protein D